MSEETSVPVLPPSQSPRSADDYLAMYDDEPVAQQESQSKEVPIEKTPSPETSSEENTGGNENGKDMRNGGEETGSKEQEKEQQKEIAAEAKKVLKAKFGLDEIEVPEEATFTAKINGKDVSFKIADAHKAFVGQEEFNRKADQRLSYINAEKASLVRSYDEVKAKAKNISEAFALGDVMGAVKQLAKMAAGYEGLDEVDYEKKALDNLNKMQTLWGSMTPEQQQLYLAQERANIYKKNLETERKSRERLESSSAIAREVAETTKTLGITEEDFRGLYQVIAQHSVGEGKDFARVEDITVKDVAKFHEKVQFSKRIDKAIEKVNPQLLNDEEFLAEVDNVIGNRLDLTTEAIEEILRGAFALPSKVVENLNKKVDAANSKGMRTQLTQASSTKKVDNEIDEELYQHFYGKRSVVTR